MHLKKWQAIILVVFTILDVAVLCIGLAVVAIPYSQSVSVAAIPTEMSRPPVSTDTPVSTSTPWPTSTPLPTLDIKALKARWGTVDIRALVKNPDKYIDAELHYMGEVFSIQELSDGVVMQVWIRIPGGSTFDREAVTVLCNCIAPEIYKGTNIEFWGYGAGKIEGTNAFGGVIQQPTISVKSGAYLTYYTR